MAKIKVNQLGALIKRRRDDLHLTQKELGLRLESYGKKRAESTISGWENGGGEVPITVLPALAAVLDISTAELLRASGIFDDAPELTLLVLLGEAGATPQDVENAIKLLRVHFEIKG